MKVYYWFFSKNEFTNYVIYFFNFVQKQYETHLSMFAVNYMFKILAINNSTCTYQTRTKRIMPHPNKAAITPTMARVICVVVFVVYVIVVISEIINI